MTFTGVMGCGNKFRRALAREPLDVQQKMMAVRQRLEQGLPKQAYYLLESTEADPATKARLYEQISRMETELSPQSKQKAIELYNRAGQTERARYLHLK